MDGDGFDMLEMVKRSDKLNLVKLDAFASGFMAWAAVSYRDKTGIQIIDKGTKVNSNFYINKVLRAFLKKRRSKTLSRRTGVYCVPSGQCF